MSDERSEMSEKRTCFKLDEKLYDGAITTIVEEPKFVAEAVLEWCKAAADGEYPGGDSITIESVELTREEFAALPEV